MDTLTSVKELRSIIKRMRSGEPQIWAKLGFEYKIFGEVPGKDRRKRLIRKATRLGINFLKFQKAGRKAKILLLNYINNNIGPERYARLEAVPPLRVKNIKPPSLSKYISTEKKIILSTNEQILDVMGRYSLRHSSERHNMYDVSKMDIAYKRKQICLTYACTDRSYLKERIGVIERGEMQFSINERFSESLLGYCDVLG